MVAVSLSLLFGTLLSEDLTCIAAGVLIQRGKIDATSAVVACALGIFTGDVGLWALGRVCGHAALAWPAVARRVPGDRVIQLRRVLARHAAAAIIGSRFLPGTRLPLYLVAGLLRLPGRVFAPWALVGTALWTPPLVLLSGSLDQALNPLLPTALGWLAPAVPVCATLLTLHLARRVVAPRLARSTADLTLTA